MLAVYQNGSSASPSAGNATVSGGGGTAFLWCATARDNTSNISGPGGTVFNDTCRTASTCYMRGLKENIEIQTNSGIPWQWRRICFTVKGLNFITGFGGAIENSNGFGRYLYNIYSGTSVDTPISSALTNLIFKGTLGQDWNDFTNAALDTSRITVKSDTTTIISSGNTSGKLKLYKRWYPMNANLVYDDDETGGAKVSRLYSTESKAGMGDYWIVDFFQPGIGSTSTDKMSFNPASTLYWHEK